MGWKPEPTKGMGPFKTEIRADTFRILTGAPFPAWVDRLLAVDAAGDVRLAEFPLERLAELRAALDQVDACLAYRARGQSDRSPSP